MRAFTSDPETSRTFLEDTLAFEPLGESGFEVRGERRGSFHGDKDNRETSVPKVLGLSIIGMLP